MQHDDPFENSSYRAADRHIPWFGIGAAIILIATVTWMVGPDRASHAGLERVGGATAYTRDQAAQTMTVIGYHSLVGLTQDAGGSWHAEGQKNGAHWRIAVSPQGLVSAQALDAAIPVPARPETK